MRHRRGRRDWTAIKVDMAKASDRLEWPFILKVLECFSFSPIWLQWVEQCISSVSFSVMLNGSPFEFFHPGRGLRQGDPLCCPRCSSVSVLKSSVVFWPNGIPRERFMASPCPLLPPISHLMYADDLILFRRANLREARAVKQVLDVYSGWSSQSMNCSKSTTTFSKNTLPEVQKVLCRELGLRPMKHDCRYLGVALFPPKSSMQACSETLEKISQRLAGWKDRNLSQASRTVLLHSVASSMPQYQMSTALLPHGWCDRVDRLFKDFWWGYFNDQRHYCPKAWDSICQPKHLGGLGLRRMHDCNLALVTKLGWKLLLQEDTLWCKSFSTWYFHNCSFWMASAGYNPSWCWSSILQARDTLRRGACFLPRDGTTISVLADPDHPT